MKRFLVILLAISIVTGCSFSPATSGKKEPGKEQTAAEQSMPVTLNEFADRYNSVLDNSSEIARPIDTTKVEDGIIYVDDQVTIRLNEEDAFSMVEFTGAPDMTIPSLILDSLGILNEAKVDKMLGEVDHAVSENQQYNEKTELNGMSVQMKFEDEVYVLTVSGT